MAEPLTLSALAGEWNGVGTLGNEVLREDWLTDVAHSAIGSLRRSGAHFNAVAAPDYDNDELAGAVGRICADAPFPAGYTVLNAPRPDPKKNPLDHHRTLLVLDHIIDDEQLTDVVGREIRGGHRTTIADVLLFAPDPNTEATKRFINTARTLGVIVHTLFQDDLADNWCGTQLRPAENLYAL